MKIIYFCSQKNEIIDVLWTFKEKKLDVTIYKNIVPVSGINQNQYEQWETKIYNYIKTTNFTCAFSWNYIPIVSNVCEKLSIPYISWIYDSPLLHVYSNTLNNSCNYIFAFDKFNCKDLIDKGAKHCYHLPLAININRLGGLNITEEDIKKYKYDISFVGSLYENNMYNKICNQLPNECIKYFESQFEYTIINEKYYNNDIKLPEHILNILKNIAQDLLIQFPNIYPNEFFNDFMFARKYAQLQRTSILEYLSEYYEVALYTYNKTPYLPYIKNKGIVDYHKQMPKVFYCSKINLNFTIPSIKTGIPLRLWDILGVGGFVITNFQSEILDYFEPDKDIVIYNNLEDLDDKISYYLMHEKELKQIKINGYKKVYENHTYHNRINYIFEKVFGYDKNIF